MVKPKNSINLFVVLCVKHFIEDTSIDKEIRDNLREIHYREGYIL